ncbi:MAG TPA: Gfo/Idh/MocA family oxidoreductase [Euzebyales bacterium]|nr:Gfo/Idh/MocA family oxidoreductase [Euzebyales bacterium]
MGDGATAVAVVGVLGHGQSHLRRLHAAAAEGVRLVGVCDTRPLPEHMRRAIGAAPVHTSLHDLLTDTRPDVTIICTPIHTHVDLALEALRAGSDVLLEKPPAATLADHERLVAGVADSGRLCQIGFQSLGSHAVPAIAEHLSAGTIGGLRGIGVAGTWVRDTSYYARSRWAGRRTLDGVPVVDGAATNPLAHALATALRIDGSDRAGQVAIVETELYHAHNIEADDTASARVTTARGTTITLALTLCAAATADPYLVIHGSRGRMTFFYTRDELHIATAAGTTVEQHGRSDLLGDLIAHRGGHPTDLLVPPQRTGGFMQFMEAVRTAPEPVAVPPEHVQVHGSGAAERRIIIGIDEAVRASAEHLRRFGELGVPWAVAPRRTTFAVSGPDAEVPTAGVPPSGAGAGRLLAGGHG